MVLAAVERIASNAVRSTPPWINSISAKASRQIEEFRGHDYSSMDLEMRAVFRAYKRLPPLRYFGIVARACKDLAPHYVKLPRRVLPASLGESEREILMRWYLRTPPITSDVEQAGVGQQSYVLFVHPDAEAPGEAPLVTPILGYQLISVEWGTSLGACDDLRKARRVRFAVPARLADRERSRVELLSFCSVVEVTRDYAIMTLPDGAQVGVLAPDGSNPLGYIPMVGRRRAKPVDRVCWIPEPAWDLRGACICATLSMSDMEHLARVEAPGILVAKGPGAKRLRRELELQPGTMLPIENEDVEVSWLQSQLDQTVMGYQRMIDRVLELVGNLRYLRQGELSGITGAAKDRELSGLYEERERQGGDLLEVERALLDVYCDAWNALVPRAQKLPTEIGHELGVHFAFARPRENVLQEAQALAVAASMGLIDVADEVATDEGITQEAADELIMERLQKHRERLPGGGETPGLDRLADQVARPMTQTQMGEPDAEGQAREAPRDQG